MVLPDVNVLIYAHREESEKHDQYLAWLEGLWSGVTRYGYSELVLSSCVRVLTHKDVFRPPTPMDAVLAYVDQIRDHPNAVRIAPGDRHWSIFRDLCRRGDARGNLVTDAYLAALAIESGSEWITTDRDFARFPGLKWRHPLDE